MARFVLPLDICKTTNFTRHSQPWQQARDKARTRRFMIEQALRQGQTRRKQALPGRPQVRCVRFTSRAPDAYSDWAKAAVDVLTIKKRGLGYLIDDDETHADVQQWSERVGRGQGFVLIEVRIGEE